MGRYSRTGKKGIILPIYKGKGSRHDCRSYWGITLLSCPGKLFAHILLARVKNKLTAMRRKEQSGFTSNRSTIDQICELNIILQGRREYRRLLWIAYVDLKAAFDSVDRPMLWLLLRSIGILLKIVGLIRELYTDTVSSVRVEGTMSDWFEIQSSVRQGCTIAPSLFLTPMDWILE
jgi:Reverse transcriptase (RNA-dependent DNA polymerase)